MKMLGVACSIVLVIGGLPQAGRGAEGLPPIEKVEIRSGRAFYVNGKPFFPLMAWLQDAENLPAVKDCGMNTTAGYWPGATAGQASSGTRRASLLFHVCPTYFFPGPWGTGSQEFPGTIFLTRVFSLSNCRR